MRPMGQRPVIRLMGLSSAGQQHLNHRAELHCVPAELCSPSALMGHPECLQAAELRPPSATDSAAQVGCLFISKTLLIADMPPYHPGGFRSDFSSSLVCVGVSFPFLLWF